MGKLARNTWSIFRLTQTLRNCLQMISVDTGIMKALFHHTWLCSALGALRSLQHNIVSYALSFVLFFLEPNPPFFLYVCSHSSQNRQAFCQTLKQKYEKQVCSFVWLESESSLSQIRVEHPYGWKRRVSFRFGLTRWKAFYSLYVRDSISPEWTVPKSS